MQVKVQIELRSLLAYTIVVTR